MTGTPDGVLRTSWRGHGWVVWLTCAGAITAAVLGAHALAVALLVIEFVAIASLISQMQRRRR